MAPLLELDHEVVYFDQGSSMISRAEEVEKVKNAARWLTLGWEWNALLKGHASREGNKAYNQDLSEKRANAVRDLLIARGVPTVLITAVGVGTSEPAVAETAKTAKELEQQRQQNRRVEITLSLNPMFARQPTARPSLWKPLTHLPPPSVVVIPREQIPPWLRKVPQWKRKELADFKKDLDEWMKEHHLDPKSTISSLLGLLPSYEDAPDDDTPGGGGGDDDG